MLLIQKMAEVVKEKGVQIYHQERNEDPNAQYKYNGVARKSFHAEQLFWDVLKRNQAFVFSPTNPTPVDLAEDNTTEFQEFDRPFDIFSIEVAGEYITVSPPDVAPERRISICSMIVSSSKKQDDAKEVYYIFVMYKYSNTFYVFLETAIPDYLTGEGKEVNLIAFGDFDAGKEWISVPNNILSGLIKKFTDRLNQTSTVGIQKVNHNIHYIGKHGKRDKAVIRQVVHIVPKSARQKYVPNSGTKAPVEWTHRFWRRGTWVNFYKEDGTIDFSKIGKDRDGNYNVPGKTWRIEALVNADREDLPIVKKQRIVDTVKEEK